MSCIKNVFLVALAVTVVSVESWLFKKNSDYYDNDYAEVDDVDHAINVAKSGDTLIITVKTGDMVNGDTNADVYVILGSDSQVLSRKVWLQNGKLNRNQVDKFTIHTKNVISPLSSLKIGHDNKGVNPSWYLACVTVRSIETGIVQHYDNFNWLSTVDEDNIIETSLHEQICQRNTTTSNSRYSYLITVKTGTELWAGTNANVYVKLYGGRSHDVTSGKVWLKGGKFESGETESFTIYLPEQLSPLSKLVIGHDDSGMLAGWYLESATVYSPSTGIKQYFPSNEWFSKWDGDGKIERELTENKHFRADSETDQCDIYTLIVKTGDKEDAGTDANVYVQLYSGNGATDKIWIDATIGAFEKNREDTFTVHALTIPTPISEIVVGHDNSGDNPSWLLEYIYVEAQSSKTKQYFPYNGWLASPPEGKLQVTLNPEVKENTE